MQHNHASIRKMMTVSDNRQFEQYLHALDAALELLTGSDPIPHSKAMKRCPKADMGIIARFRGPPALMRSVSEA